MWKRALIATLVAIPTSPLLAEASLDNRLERAEKRLEQLESQLKGQESTDMDNTSSDSSDPWYKHFRVSGVIEVEAVYADPEDADSESSLDLATAELGIAVEINPRVTAEIVLLYEDDGEEELDVDVAAITFIPTDNWSITAGQYYVPFGVFETQMVSDPLTLELGEARETALQTSWAQGIFGVSAYLFDGDASEDGDSRIDNFGIDLALGQETESFTYSVNLGYINDIGDTDGLIDYAGDIHDRVAGLSASLVLSSGPITLIGEYVGAVDEFDATGEEPSAYNLELGYEFELAGIEAHAAIGTQGTDDALGVGLPEDLIVTALRIEPIDEIYLALEFARMEDYSGIETDTLTFQIAAEF